MSDDTQNPGPDLAAIANRLFPSSAVAPAPNTAAAPESATNPTFRFPFSSVPETIHETMDRLIDELEREDIAAALAAVKAGKHKSTLEREDRYTYE